MATTYLGPVLDHRIRIIPSQNLKDFIKSINILDTSEDITFGIKKSIYSGLTESESVDCCKTKYLVTEDDQKCINLLKSKMSKITENTLLKPTYAQTSNTTMLGDDLLIQDLYWLYKYIQTQNTNCITKIYLHELLEGSDIILPKNEVILRSEELDKRCKILEAEKLHKEYLTMTKNINCLQKNVKEDTIAFQINMMNRHLIAIFQFILSIITGFVFGFFGIEMMTTPLDLGFRLLLGIICSLVIAVADLYFLAKALNMELNDDTPEVKQKIFKID